jgi:ABC-type multidrug transport system ATPase subunit
MHAVVVEKISKTYEKTNALKNVTFNVAPGELFGVIGPDGAGKTSLFRILVSLLLPNSGSATVVGLDVVKQYKTLRKKVGYMPGKFSLYQDLTVEENLNFFAGIFNTTIEENYHLIEAIYKQIEPFKDRRAGALSGGMKQKLALSCALIHKPEILFLDEPTTGVDAVSRMEFWEMLISLKKSGITIVVSTPYMDEATLCDRVALIQNGEILKIDSPSGIMGGFQEKIISLKTKNTYELIKKLKQHPAYISAYPFGNHVHFTVVNDFKNIDELRINLSNSGHEIEEIKFIEPGIEDCFMSLMKKENV